MFSVVATEKSGTSPKKRREFDEVFNAKALLVADESRSA
jgi:hypothetical protein